GGRVLVNGMRVKPSKDVHPDDSVEVRVGQTRSTVLVVAVADKRGSATAAAALYQETPESIALSEQRALERRLASPPGADLGARPTKQAPRRLDALRRSEKRRKRGT